ncbi:molecular chaperone, HSP90 family [Anaerolinea thermolimosa]|uniref:molecular chaperone HtpG n=1 Tax=Anaerolinea thermolimosa TaxID=229919 RepID=UPI000785D6FE|nr:molecular chaperone HtpG [Anaerolinea thermolimosa]GAP06510.1 molecular chaperone, HSP90 family [Anaerolinea thermolimosa]
MSDNKKELQAIPFKAETRQLLNILIHSLYSEREVFLRELISNASDALTRLHFETLTNRNILDPDVEMGIWITPNETERTLTIRDTGIGMTLEEMVENLGTIAQSGARVFLQAAESNPGNLSDIIGQFGVGFYSAFMVAEWIRVESRSFRPEAQGAIWFSTGDDTFTVEPADIHTRGTTVTIKLKEDALEFTRSYRLREIIKKHSDYIPYPIYLGEDKEQVNQQTALWRTPPREVAKEQAFEFYRQLTLDFNEPLTYLHLNIDAPVQLYALLFIPSTPEKPLFSPRKEDGLKLYARKVLIQEYCRDILPNYFRFVQGVVDSEDIPLNVSRETIQASKAMPQLKKVVTRKLLDHLNAMGKDQADNYAKFWKAFGAYIKEGVATDHETHSDLVPLLRFVTLNHPDSLISLDQYIEEAHPDQKKIYYLLGDDPRAVFHSPHLDLYRKNKVDVLLLSDPLDPFVMLSLTQYKDYSLVNAALEKPQTSSQEPEPEPEESLPLDEVNRLIRLFKERLGEKVSEVRSTDRLTTSPVRLVNKDGSLQQEVQKVYQLMRKEYTLPEKILEINPSHELIKQLSSLPEEDERVPLAIDQLFENALLIEGLHPDPAGMVDRINRLLKTALK